MCFAMSHLKGALHARTFKFVVFMGIPAYLVHFVCDLTCSLGDNVYIRNQFGPDWGNRDSVVFCSIPVFDVLKQP